MAHEVGDLLFATVNVARLLHVDPELALREAGNRFERRVTGRPSSPPPTAGTGRRSTCRAGGYYQRAKGGEAPVRAASRACEAGAQGRRSVSRRPTSPM